MYNVSQGRALSSRLSGAGVRKQPWAVGLVAALAILAISASPASAQPRESRVQPNDLYFAVFVPFYEGEYRDALKGFRDAARSGVRTSEGRWIDSICYHTMMGECYYHMGKLPDALEQYNNALKLYLVNTDWMRRLQFPPTIGPSSSSVLSTVNWGVSSRRMRLGHFPDKTMSFQGRLNNNNVIRHGGVVAPPTMYPLRVHEIVRCTALAIRRRRELMGAACQHDSLTNSLVNTLAARPGPANHWSRAWIDVQLGLAYAAAGKVPEAITELKRSVVVGGTYDHPLTATALFAMGKLAFEQGQYDLAANFFLETTFAAAAFNQADLMEEGFRYGMIVHLVSGKKGIYPPLLRAPSWSRVRNFPALRASLLLLSCENLAAAGETAGAAGQLDQARRILGRSDMQAGNLGARFQYLTAMVNYQKGNAAVGDTALATAMTYQKTGSKWLFRINLVDSLFRSGGVTPRVASILYEHELREPEASDWTNDPMETFSVVLTPHIPAMEHWLLISLKRKEPEKALQIADRIRRQRFFNTQLMGGRLVALRWILESPKTALSEKAQLQRQDLLARYPQYAVLAREAQEIRGKLADLPVVPKEKDDIRQQSELLAKWSKISLNQEIILRQIAVRREASEFVFPPLRTADEIRDSMTDGQLALVFFAGSRFVYAFLFTRENYAYWPVDAPGKVRTQVAEMLRKMGHFKRDYQLGKAELNNDEWKKPAGEILQLLTNRDRPDFWGRYNELIIVPDGMLWYLPFEALQVPTDTGTAPLISKIRIRYAPTASLIVPDGRGSRPLGRTAVVVGKLFPGDDAKIAAEEFDRLKKVLPDSVAIEQKLSGSSALLGTTWDRLIVLDDVDDAIRVPYDWAPAQVDHGKLGSKLAHWMQLPFGGPDQIILPGFHTAAEEALKNPAGGYEVFLTICGLMSTGTRTMLISRWRCGGRIDYDLVREFAQELPHTSASNAWQRAVELTMSTEIDPAREPRVKLPSGSESPTAAHPLFWAGHMLLDTGAVPPK